MNGDDPKDTIAAATPESIQRAAGLLRAGELVAFPTETVYGLGADATNDGAIGKVYEVKGRPASNPLIIHVAAMEEAREIAEFDRRAEILAETFWPGPLTLVLPRREKSPITRRACAGLDTVAVRIPNNKVALTLLRSCERPIAGPSANRSGRTSPTTARHVWDSLGGTVAMILDGGLCTVGIESTVLNLAQDSPLLLRPGDVSANEIAELIGPIAEPTQASEAMPTSPGRALSHYAPALPVRLHAIGARRDEALLAFGPDVPQGAAKTLNLSPEGDVEEAAANLYRMLIELDDPAYSGIAVMAVPEKGVGRAINDRLKRAAAPRPGA